MGILVDVCNKIDAKWNEGIEPDLMLMNQDTYDELMGSVTTMASYPDDYPHYPTPTLQRIPIAIANVEDVLFYKLV